VRIVFATHAYAPAVGGAERYAQGLAEAIADAGHDVHVLTPNRDSAEAFYEYGHAPFTLREEELSGVHVRRIDLTPPHRRWRPQQRSGPIPSQRARSMWAAYRDALHAEIARIHPDAVVTLPHAFPNVEAAFTAGASNATVYAPLLHEFDPAWDVGTITSLVSRADFTIAMTTWERGRLVEAYGADATRVVIAPPGVDAPDETTVTPWKASGPYVVSIGRRVASKRLPQVAEAVSALRDEGLDLKHMIVGPAGEPAVDDVLAKLGDAVEIVDEVNEATKWSLIKGAVASVSFSERESFGIAAVESWRMRRPVISRRTPVAAELVDDGRTGFLVEDITGLEDALRHLHQDRRASDTMGIAGYERAREFSWNRSAQALLEALHTDPA